MALFGVIRLIHRENYRFIRLVQHSGHVFVGLGDPLLVRYQEDDHVRLFHGNLGLGDDLGHQGSIINVDPPGIDQRKFLTQPLRRSV